MYFPFLPWWVHYNETRDGIVDTINDRMYVIDDFGNLVQTEFCLNQSWFDN